MNMPIVEQKTDNAVDAINIIAIKEGCSSNEVCQSIKIAVLVGMLNEDPEVRKMWQSIPCKNEYPEPEEVIAWLSNLAEERIKSN